MTPLTASGTEPPGGAPSRRGLKAGTEGISRDCAVRKHVYSATLHIHHRILDILPQFRPSNWV